MLARGFSAPGDLYELVDHVVPVLQSRGAVAEAVRRTEAVR